MSPNLEDHTATKPEIKQTGSESNASHAEETCRLRAGRRASLRVGRRAVRVPGSTPLCAPEDARFCAP